MNGPGSLRDYVALTKPGITRHVLVAAAAGYVLAGPSPFAPARLVALLAGTALVSGGTNALNHWWERDVDARMVRTRARPVASGRVAPSAALGFSLAIGALGVAVLAATTNLLTAALAALTLTSYVLAYTPLKKRTPFCVAVGCVSGALPILGGWTAATGRVGAGGAALFAVLYLWQVPHTLALAWLHREDYRAGGLRLPGADDPIGARSARGAFGAACALGVASLLPVAAGVAGGPYLWAAVALGGGLVALAKAWTEQLSEGAARRLFAGTVAYLPLLLVAMMAWRAT